MEKGNIIIFLIWIVLAVGLVFGIWYFGFNEEKVIQEIQTSSGIEKNITKENILTEQNKTMNIITLKTNLGDIKLELFENDAPKTVANFIKLSKDGFYNGTRFHRVIKDFMIQGGDPNSKDDNWADDGMGGPGYQFEDEINSHKLVRGVLAMANAGPNTNGSQFFIVTAQATPWLDGKHTAFGRVMEGMDVVDKIEAIQTFANDNPRGGATIEQIIIQ